MDSIVSIQLAKNSDEPMYVQLYMELKRRIEEGKLPDSQKLPPIRKMSECLKVNPVTVINAYKLLERNGYAYSRVGSGIYVLGKRAGNAGMLNQEYGGYMKADISAGANTINFANSSPDPELFPIDDFKFILNMVLDRDGGRAFEYTEVKGYSPLRECISGIMNKNGISCSTDDIQVISGAQQGIDIVAKAMVDYGDIIITERPTYTGAIAVFKSRGADIIDIPINAGGIDMDKLEEALKKGRPKFVYVMTSFQNPTGFSYSDDAKKSLINLADKYDFYIIEDDYLSELYYTKNKPTLIKQYDDSNRVILIKSFSKLFMPGMRIGFLIVPPKLQYRISAAKHLSDISTSGLIQRAFDMYIRNNLLDRHIEYIRQKYCQRYNAIIEGINSFIKGASYCRPEGGIHVWIKLPFNVSSNMLYSECMMENVVISPGSSFYINDPDDGYIRLSFASLGLRDIKNGLTKIGGIVERLTGHNS